MRTVVLMRHGHAEDGSDDHGRELTEEGRLAAQRAASLLRMQQLVPQRVISSSAVRALQTARILREELGILEPVQPRSSLYLASPDVYLQSIRDLEDTLTSAIVVAHNPGLSHLARVLGAPGNLRPAEFFVAQQPIQCWKDLSRCNGG